MQHRTGSSASAGVLDAARGRWSVPRGRRISAATAVVGALLLAGCSGSGGGVGGIETADGESLQKAEATLAEATDAWSATLSTEDVETSEETRCYFVVGDDEAVTEQIACGGVRTPMAEEGHVWSVGSFEVRQNSDEEMEAHLPEGWAGELERGVERPGAAVVDADGEPAPEEIDALAAPPVPQAPDDLVVADEELPVDLAQPGDETSSPQETGQVITPAGTLAVRSVAQLETVPMAAGQEDSEESSSSAAGQEGSSGDAVLDPSGRPHGPSEGQAFYLIDYTFEPADAMDEELTAALALRSAGQQTTLANFEESGGGFGSSSSQDHSVLVSADAEESSLIISSSGVDQQVELPSGERTSNETAAAYYRDVTQQDLNHEFSVEEPTFTVGEDESTLSSYLNIQSARLTAYSEAPGADGWAEPGTAWLVLEQDATFSSEDSLVDLIELTAEFSAVDGSGDAHSTSTDLDVGYRGVDGAVTVAIPVPAGAEDFTLSSSWSGRAENLDDEKTSISAASDSLEVSFPQEDEGDEDSEGSGDEKGSGDEESSDEEPDSADEGSEDENSTDESAPTDEEGN